ncbi:MAG: protease complex subunit PrcB family protein [Fimbriimonadaceae bacterium]
MVRSISLLVLTALSLGANDASSQMLPGVPGPQWRTFHSGSESRVGREQTFVLQTEGAWQQYWAEAHGLGPERAPRGPDWSQWMAAAIHLGPRPNPGFSAYVESVTLQSGVVTVRWVEAAPGFPPIPPPPGVRSLSPYTVVFIQRVAGNIQFQKRLGSASVGGVPASGSVVGVCPDPWCPFRHGYPVVIGVEVDFPAARDGGRIPTLPGEAVRWGTVHRSAFGRIAQPTTRVIRTEGDWQTYWAAATGQPPQNAPRSIDWMTEIAVAIHAGEFPSGGASVAVTGVRRERGDIVIDFTVRTPAPGAPSATVMTAPFTVIRLERVAGNIRFNRTNRAVADGTPRPGHCLCGRRLAAPR